MKSVAAKHFIIILRRFVCSFLADEGSIRKDTRNLCCYVLCCRDETNFCWGFFAKSSRFQFEKFFYLFFLNLYESVEKCSSVECFATKDFHVEFAQSFRIMLVSSCYVNILNTLASFAKRCWEAATCVFKTRFGETLWIHLWNPVDFLSVILTNTFKVFKWVLDKETVVHEMQYSIRGGYA